MPCNVYPRSWQLARSVKCCTDDHACLAARRDEKHPIGFGRDVLAELAGVPRRADWRQCKMASAKAEEEASQAFQKFYEPFR